MVDEVIIPSLKMGASYEQYLLGKSRREGGKFCRKGAYKRSPPERPNSPGESFAVEGN